jgi:predicted GNAT family N-acyltransferase
VSTGRTVGEGFDSLDALAHVLIARAAPVRFDVASSAAEQRQIFGLRYETVVEEGWVASTDYPDRLERDAFDDAAVHVAGWQDAELVATARLVFPEQGRKLPTELEFELTVQPQGAVVDIGRAIVSREYRSRDHTLFGGLLSRCWVEIRRRGYVNLCGTASGSRLERYRQFGLPLRIVGPPRHYWGEERYPVFLEGREFAAFAQLYAGQRAGKTT